MKPWNLNCVEIENCNSIFDWGSIHMWMILPNLSSYFLALWLTSWHILMVSWIFNPVILSALGHRGSIGYFSYKLMLMQICIWNSATRKYNGSNLNVERLFFNLSTHPGIPGWFHVFFHVFFFMYQFVHRRRRRRLRRRRCRRRPQTLFTR